VARVRAAIDAELAVARTVDQLDEIVCVLGEKLAEVRRRRLSASLYGEILRLVAASPGLTSNKIQERVRGQRGACLDALRELEKQGRLWAEPDPRSRARLWHLAGLMSLAA
jgi:hypothetical protein